MNLQTDILELIDIVSGIVPVDLSAAANDGDYVNLRDYEGVLVVVFKKAGTAGDDPVITLTQAKDNAGTGAKALTFTRLKTKIGTLTGVGTWTTVTQTAASTYNGDAGGSSDVALAENQALIAIQVRGAQLDVTNNFTHLKVSIADIGANAQLGCAFYILYGNKHAQATPVSAL